MSTITSLPNEILIKIFKEYLVLPKDGFDFHDDMRFILLGVCRAWRKLVTHERLLWTTIEINERCVIPRPLQSMHVNPPAIFFRTLLAFLCSRNLPVNVTINLPYNTKYFSLHHCAILALILRREAPRIESLSVSGIDWEMHLWALHGIKDQPMPLLRSFTHHASSCLLGAEGFEVYADNIIPILQYPSEKHPNLDTVNQWGRTLYPNLTHLEISEAPYDFNLLPTSGLREFGISHQPMDACPCWLVRDMLYHCADTLENFWMVDSLHYDDQDDTDDDDAIALAVWPAVVLTNLKRLFIDYEYPTVVAKYLMFIRAPALEQLDLAYSPTYEEEWEYVNPTDTMLVAMMKSFSLNRLQRLVLLGVVFKDIIPIPERDAFLIKGRVSPEDVPMTLRFLGSLTSVTLMSLCLPLAQGQPILPLLNYPRVPSFGTDGEVLQDAVKIDVSRHLAYLPALECLHLTNVGSAKKNAEVEQFIDDRVEITVWEKDVHVIIERGAVGDTSEVLL